MTSRGRLSTWLWGLAALGAMGCQGSQVVGVGSDASVDGATSPDTSATTDSSSPTDSPSPAPDTTHGSLQDSMRDVVPSGEDTNTSTDATPDAAAEVAQMDAGNCGNIRSGTTAMALVDGYCIDVHEVNNTQYNDFLDDSTRATLAPSFCQGNLSAEQKETLSASGNFPRRGVYWCWAKTYCAWAQKRLCGARNSTSSTAPNTAYTDFNNRNVSQWYNACVNGAANTKYTYGATCVPGRCVTKYSTDFPVQSFPDCHGMTPPYDAIHDLNGNAAEWEDSCDTYPPSSLSRCRLRGGNIGDDGNATCDFHADYSMGATFSSAGFRCCKDL